MRGVVPTALAAAALALSQPALAAAKCALSATAPWVIAVRKFMPSHRSQTPVVEPVSTLDAIS